MNPLSALARYTRWLHTRWPAGAAEPLPEIREDGSTRVPGLYVAGALASGRHTSRIFIENGRFHGEAIVRSILSR